MSLALQILAVLSISINACKWVLKHAIIKYPSLGTISSYKIRNFRRLQVAWGQVLNAFRERDLAIAFEFISIVPLVGSLN